MNYEGYFRISNKKCNPMIKNIKEYKNKSNKLENYNRSIDLYISIIKRVIFLIINNKSLSLKKNIIKVVRFMIIKYIMKPLTIEIMLLNTLKMSILGDIYQITFLKNK